MDTIWAEEEEAWTSRCFSGASGAGGRGERGLICKRFPGFSAAHTAPPTHTWTVLSEESSSHSNSSPTWTVLPENLPKILLMSQHSPAQKLPAVASHCPGRAQPFHWHESHPQAQCLCLWTRLLSGVSLLCRWCHRLIDSPRMPARMRRSLPMFYTRKLRLRDTD